MPTRKEVNCLTGEVVEIELTQAEIDAIAAQPPTPGPTPLEQIRALEAARADDVAKVTRQALILQTINIALASPQAAALTAGMTPEQAQAAVVGVLLQSDPGFKLMYELELAIAPLRAQIP